MFIIIYIDHFNVSDIIINVVLTWELYNYQEFINNSKIGFRQ